MQKRPEAAAIEVAPHTLLVVVVQPDLLVTLGAGPLRLVMLREDVDALLLHVELNAVNGPWLLQPEQLAIQVSVTHPSTVALSRHGRAATRRLVGEPPNLRMPHWFINEQNLVVDTPNRDSSVWICELDLETSLDSPIGCVAGSKHLYGGDFCIERRARPVHRYLHLANTAKYEPRFGDAESKGTTRCVTRLKPIQTVLQTQ